MILIEERQRGTIINVLHTMRYGFIQYEGRVESIFFHLSGVTGIKWDDLREGQKVSFLVIQNNKGDKAVGVEALSNA